MFHHLTRGCDFFRHRLTPSCIARARLGATMAGTERENGRLCGSGVFGKQPARRASTLSCPQVCAGQGARLQPARRSVAGRRAGNRLSAHGFSRLGGISRQIFGRSAACRGRRQQGERKAVSHHGHRIFCADLCLRRAVDGGVLLFRHRDRGRYGLLRRTRARRARLLRRGDLSHRSAQGRAGALPILQSRTKHLCLRTRTGRKTAYLARLCGQRELPFVPRKARLRDRRGRRVCALRRASRGGRKDMRRHGQRRGGASRLCLRAYARRCERI